MCAVSHHNLIVISISRTVIYQMFLIPSVIRLINGNIAVAPECDVFHLSARRFSDIILIFFFC